LAVFVALASLLLGCGGSGGVLNNGTTTTVGGGTTFVMSSSIKINGGQLLTGTTPPTAAGVYTFVLKDNVGDTTTFSNVLLPLPSTSTIYNIIRAGSKLFSGAYSSQTATIHDQAGNQGTIPLNSDGTLAQDIATSLGQLIVLPISSDGTLTFQGGVTVSPNIIVSNNTQDIALTYSSTPSSLALGTIGGTLSFSGGGTSGTYAKVGINFEGPSSSASAPNLSVEATTAPPSRSSTLVGNVTGPNLVYSNSTVTVNVND
jgi:hypothetical protein